MAAASRQERLQMSPICRAIRLWLRKINLFGNSRVSNADLKRLAQLKKIRGLMLAGTPISDEGVAHLAGLSSLEELRLDETRVTSIGVKVTDGMSSLIRLGIANLDIGDADLRTFKRLP